MPTEVLTVRDFRRRPHLNWRDAWAHSAGHELSTISTWTYARETLTLGGFRALAPALLLATVGIALVGAAAFGAALLATTASGTASRAWLVILLSVALSQVVGSVQARKLPRRAIVAASERVRSTPPGVQIVDIEVNADEASALAAVLEAHGFLYVEIIYYRDEQCATLSAYFSRERGHGHELAAQALSNASHRLGTIYEL